MKKCICIFLSIIFLINSLVISCYAEPMPIANPTDTEEIFTPQELIALILSSKVTYRIKGKSSQMDEEQVYSGTVTPILDSFADEDYSNSAGYLPFLFPIPEFDSDYPIIPSEFSLIFDFPFKVRKLDKLFCFVSPFIYFDGVGQQFPNFPKSYDLLYQIDGSGSVIDSFSVSVSTTSDLNSLDLSSGVTISTLCGLVPPSPSGIMFYSHNDFYPNDLNSGMTYSSLFNAVNSSFYSYDFLLNGGGSTIDSFGFTFYPKFPDGNGFPSSFKGIGFCFSPMAITYYSGGGYVSADSGDSGGSGSIDYSQILDDIYNLINDASWIILNNQSYIYDAITGIQDTLTNPSPEQEQEAEEREAAVSDMVGDLDQLQQDLEVEQPELNPEDYNFTDDPWWSDSVEDVGSIFDLFTDNFRWLTTILVAVSGLVIIRLIIYGTNG